MNLECQQILTTRESPQYRDIDERGLLHVEPSDVDCIIDEVQVHVRAKLHDMSYIIIGTTRLTIVLSG